MAVASGARFESSMLFWRAGEILEAEMDIILGWPVILLEARPVENCLLLGASAGGERGAKVSDSAMDTTIYNK
jgi:hypothetical protein